jgi:branched-chain amino acid transport system ATP-binding protein
VLLFGADISDAAENRRTALGMGRTFQISNICTDLSVRENLQLAALGNDRRKWSMTRPAASFPDINTRVEQSLKKIGLASRAEDEVKFLSYGERRQLELALALISDPRVLLLDEPCAGLSPSERQGFSRIISALPRDITLLMIEHDIDIALALADRVTVLHRGRVILDGTPGEVQNDEQVREVYFGRV